MRDDIAKFLLLFSGLVFGFFCGAWTYHDTSYNNGLDNEIKRLNKVIEDKNKTVDAYIQGKHDYWINEQFLHHKHWFIEAYIHRNLSDEQKRILFAFPDPVERMPPIVNDDPVDPGTVDMPCMCGDGCECSDFFKRRKK